MADDDMTRQVTVITMAPDLLRHVNAIFSSDRFIFTGLNILNVALYVGELLDGLTSLSNVA